MSPGPALSSSAELVPSERGALIHPLAVCESSAVGSGTRVWAFAHLLPGAIIGAECNICDHTFVENDVVVGDRVTVKPGVQLWDGIRIEDDVFLGPNATFANDAFPRSRQHPDRYEVTTVRAGASVGANATILPGVTIGRHAMVGAGAVVVSDVPPRTVVVGNPARIVAHLDGAGRPAEDFPALSRTRSAVNGVELRDLAAAQDLRGSLAAGEAGSQIPFDPRRIFTVYAVPNTEIRGQHAHRECEQFLVAVSGSVTVDVDDGEARERYLLDDPRRGLYVPPRVWAEQHRFTPGAVLLVVASDAYDPADYIRDYDEFLAFVAGH